MAYRVECESLVEAMLRSGQLNIEQRIIISQEEKRCSGDINFSRPGRRPGNSPSNITKVRTVFRELPGKRPQIRRLCIERQPRSCEDTRNQ
jgi:hypothetical protein